VTVCATIGSKKVESLRFYFGGGTTIELFEEYFGLLAQRLAN